MTIKELVEQLQKATNQEQKVLVYIHETEEYGNIVSLMSFTNEDDLPYSKTDKPDLPEDGLMLISGNPV